MINTLRFIAIGLGLAAALHDAPAKELKLDELFPKDRLLEVKITLSGADWDKIRYQRRTRENALPPSRKFEPPPPPYSYVEASVTIDGVTYPKVGLRKKGFLGSQDTTRPSLKVKLDYSDKKGNIDGLRNLTFNNNRQDASLMSQFMGYEFWDAAGAPGSRCAFAKVTVNGRNLGVYCHVETVREPLLRREFGSDKGTLFEGTVVDFYPEWEGSFERKTGDDKKGRAHLVKVINAMQGGNGEPFFGGDVPGRAWTVARTMPSGSSRPSTTQAGSPAPTAPATKSARGLKNLSRPISTSSSRCTSRPRRCICVSRLRSATSTRSMPPRTCCSG